MPQDAKYGIVKITWDYPVSSFGDDNTYGNTWATVNTKYFITVVDYGKPHTADDRAEPVRRTYVVQHPTNFLLTYIRWGAWFRVEVWAADAAGNKATKIVAADLKQKNKPRSGVYLDLDFPGNDTTQGTPIPEFVDQPFEDRLRWILYDATFPILDNTWIYAETVFTDLDSKPFLYEGPTELVDNAKWFSVNAKGDTNTIRAVLIRGCHYRQNTTIHYPEGVSVTFEEFFTAENA